MKIPLPAATPAVLAAACLACAACGSPGHAQKASDERNSKSATAQWKPDSVDNEVLEAGPGAMAAGNGYGQIATRAKDPRPLSAHDLSSVVGRGPSKLNTDCASAVTGQEVRAALAAGDCSQVLRVIATAPDNAGGHATGLIDVFNLASGTAVYKAAGALGHEPLYDDRLMTGKPPLPHRSPQGFIRSWPGTPAAYMATSFANSAIVNGLGHFLIVIWVRGEPNSSIGNDGAASLFDDAMSNFPNQRLLSGSP